MASFFLRPVAPFRLDLTVWALRRVPINIMDRWDGQIYRRVLVVRGRPVVVAIEQVAAGHAPRLRVETFGRRIGAREQELLAVQLERMLGLRADLHEFHGRVGEHKGFAALVAPFIGVKPPRFPSVFEAVLNGIACQQLSLIVGIHLLNRLSATFGPAVGDQHAFPRPEDLADRRRAQIRRLGFSGRKAGTIHSLARAIMHGEVNLEDLAAKEDAVALEALLSLAGVGRWTAEYVLLRGLGRWDTFPADDVGSQGKLQSWLHLRERPGYDRVQQILAPWKPYRGLIYFFLLLNHLRGEHLLSGVAEAVW
jgi:DNA-3-methyladenine glycosylase II